MSLTNAFETELLALLFNNVALPDVGNAGGLQPSSAAGSFFVSLHAAAPAETDALQSVSEMTYTGYSRQAVVRSSAGWTIAGNVADNTALITFGENTGASETSTNFGIGSAASGVGDLQFIGTAALVVGTNVNPQAAIGAFDITLD